jgi:putative flippase GtrA
MSDRTQRFIAEVGRFLAVGGAATIVALVIFNLLVHGFNTGDHALLGQEPILAFIIANTVGMGVSYYGSRHWAFRDRPPVSSDGGLKSFVLINLLTMLIPIACLAISRDVLGLDDPLSDNVSANMIGLVLGLTARFALFRTFVFKRPISIVEIYDEPGLPDETPAPDGDAGSVNESEAVVRSESLIGPFRPPNPDPGT